MVTVKDKVCIVTGSTRGIGYAIARLFGKEGAKVVVTGRNEEDCIRVSEEIIREGGEALPVTTDVGDPASLDSMMDTVIDRYGRIDVLVNNVAMKIDEPFLEATRAVVEEGFGVIFEAAYFGSQRAAREMVSRGIKGRIIHIGSTAALYGERNHSLYCSMKAGLMNLARAMALELGEYGITVNVVNPGSTVRPNDPRSEEVLESFRKLSCLPELNRPEDIAPIVAFLASDLARGITGQTISADAGYSVAMQPEKLR